MSDFIKHECGLAMVRLLKPLDFYQEKYGSSLYGLNKLRLLMQKQRNRGQDGAGIATIKFDMPQGKRYISRKRNNSPQYLKGLFKDVYEPFQDVEEHHMQDPNWLKLNKPYIGELYLGHLRYGTHGLNNIETCHPFLRSNNWITRNLVLAGNFNLTNVDELFEELVALGQHPKEQSDSITILEKIGHFLDDEVQRLYNWFKADGLSNQEITHHIAENMDVGRMLQRAIRKFDGGYVLAGMVGHGDSFVIRDSNGIRPAYYYLDDEVLAVASEKPAIQTSFGIKHDQVLELKPGHAIIAKKNGYVEIRPIKDSFAKTSCSFERIYFSRGTDRDIYKERKKLGSTLAQPVLNAIKNDIENTVFTFIPNTAEISFYGLVEGLNDILDQQKIDYLTNLNGKPNQQEIADLFAKKIRVEKLAIKDDKMRTFIADDHSRNEMVSHVYDVTYGLIRNNIDTIVAVDDSIVRGTTLQQSILKILATLSPKKIIIVSSAPQIRYPDCYGIDMSKMHQFVAFKALIALLKENKLDHKIMEVYEKCKQDENKAIVDMNNQVQALYDLFSFEQMNFKIGEIIKPKDVIPNVQVIYQTIQGLHDACPGNSGDWYFSGNYPTPGGNRVANRAFINYVERKNVRAYS